MVKLPPGIRDDPVGAVGGDVTVTIAKLEFTLPTGLLTRTQYVVLPVKSGVVKLAELVPTGAVVVPTAP